MADDAPDAPGTPAPLRPCPICRKPMQQRYRPFCSKRCADVDLSRWLKGAYVVPGAEEDEDAPGSGEERG